MPSTKHDPDSYVKQYGVEALKVEIKYAEHWFFWKLKYLMSLHNVDEVEGRSKIIISMLGTIKLIKNDYERHQWTNELARIFEVPVDLLNKIKVIK